MKCGAKCDISFTSLFVFRIDWKAIQSRTYIISLKKIWKEECLCSFNFVSLIISAAVLFYCPEPTPTRALSFQTSTSTAAVGISTTAPITSLNN